MKLIYEAFRRPQSAGRPFNHVQSAQPGGALLDKGELEKVGDICVRYQIPIISDEIHSDLMLYGHRHTVMAGVSRRNC